MFHHVFFCWEDVLSSEQNWDEGSFRAWYILNGPAFLLQDFPVYMIIFWIYPALRMPVTTAIMKQF